jgi:hypothetical protein
MKWIMLLLVLALVGCAAEQEGQDSTADTTAAAVDSATVDFSADSTMNTR